MERGEGRGEREESPKGRVVLVVLPPSRVARLEEMERGIKARVLHHSFSSQTLISGRVERRTRYR